MEFICQVDIPLFMDAVKSRLNEENEQNRHAECAYEIMAQDENHMTLCLWQNHKVQKLAHLGFEEVEGDTRVTLFFETVKRETPLSIGPKVAARATIELIKGAIAWAGVYGISYLLGNRNLLLPLIAPVILWLIPAIGYGIRRRGANDRMEKLLTDMLGVSPKA